MIRRNKELVERQVKNHKLTTKIFFILLGTVLSYVAIGAMGLKIAAERGIELDKLQSPRTGLAAICILCMIVATFTTFYFMKRILKPIEDISKALKKVSKGDFSVHIEYRGKVEELESAVWNFNRMVKELNSVEIMRNDFIADVSHEFKTPLSALSGYATFLQDTELSVEEREEYIRKIFFNIDKLNDLTDNILRLSKLEHQQYADNPVVYRLDEQIREAVVLLEPKWSRKHIDLEIDMPEITFQGQKSLLFQVWTNIISNAIKYSDDGGKIAIYMKVKNDYAKVMISDNGIGMSEETQKHIFDKFYQGDTSRKSQGNGLGLALCKEIVGKCGGEIYVESTVGVGSVFVVRLPGVLPVVK